MCVMLLVLAVAVSVDGAVYVVGGGPGGLGAARRLAQLGIKSTVIEAGPHSPVDYDAPIATTTLEAQLRAAAAQDVCPCTMRPLLEVKGMYLGSGLGGTQNINGAVFAPGSAADLAASVGVSVPEAERAQALAAAMVEHTTARPTGMMWRCITPPPVGQCDSSTYAVQNTAMARRSIATEPLPRLVTVVPNCEVVSVAEYRIITRNACNDVRLARDDVVIMAAGALRSPELLGYTRYTGWNHYYTTAVRPVATAVPQSFTYGPNGAYELNRGMISVPQEPAGMVSMELVVNMTMYPTIREEHVANEPYRPPAGLAPGLAQAWHFAGTVPHDHFRAVLPSGEMSPYVFIGDASALKTPFNCHTSMPAVAAGILAAEAAVGELPRYNCLTKELWPPDKAAWCCANRNLGCPSCRGAHVYSTCHSACPLVCGMPAPAVCTEQCVVGCGCPRGTWEDGVQCVDAAMCPPPPTSAPFSPTPTLVFQAPATKDKSTSHAAPSDTGAYVFLGVMAALLAVTLLATLRARAVSATSFLSHM